MSILKKITALIVLFSFLAGSLSLVTAISRISSSGEETRVKLEFEQFYKQKENSLDVVMIGSSAMYRDYITVENWKNFGFTSYSLASVAQPFEATKYMIEEALKTQNPSLFVVEIRQFARMVNREKNNLEVNQTSIDEMKRFLANCMPFSKNRYEMIKDILPDDVFYSNFDFIRNHSKWSNMKFSVFWSNLFAEKTYEEFVSTKCQDMSTGCKIYKKQEWDTKEYFELPENSLSELEELLSYIEKRGVEVLFVSTPYYESKEFKIIENSIGNYLGKRGFNYLNCNNFYDELDIDFTTDFYDDRHTNVLGALKVTNFLGEYISKNYTFTHVYSIEIKNKWNRAYIAWMSVRKKMCNAAKKNAEEAAHENSAGSNSKT